MIQKIVVSICLLFSLGILAQQGTSSPYSYYGIGEIKFRGTFDNRAMGGLSVFPDSTHVKCEHFRRAPLLLPPQSAWQKVPDLLREDWHPLLPSDKHPALVRYLHGRMVRLKIDRAPLG